MELENPNSVCFIAKITEINKILGADQIEQAKIGEWSCIIKVNSQKVGDLIICCTTDAIIPDEIAESFGIKNYLRKGNRVRTIKLKGVYSECLLLPYSMIPEKMGYHGNIEKYNPEGTDLMAKFSIFKYEEPVKMVQLSSGRKYKYKANPNFHIYFKFPNFKNVPDIFTEDDEVVITRKLHGSNGRWGLVKKSKLSLWDRIKSFITKDKWIGYSFTYGSHLVEKGSDSQGFYDTDIWQQMSDKYDIKAKLWAYCKRNMTPEQIGSGFIIYGEVYGEGIQKNYNYGLKEIRLALFDIEINGGYIADSAFQYIVAADEFGLKLPFVEYLYEGKWSREIQDKLVGGYINGTKTPHEGIVIKSVDGDRRKRAKCVNPEYLIHSEKHNLTDFH